MPKTRRKDRKKGGSGGDSRQPSDEEYDSGDTCSMVSAVSDIGSITGPEGWAAEQQAAGGLDEEALQDEFEDKLKDCLEACQQKGAKGRQENLLSLRTALSKKYIFDFVQNRKVTICDILERCMKKGKGEEPGLAATAAILLGLQLGTGDDTAEIYTNLAPIMKVLLVDPTANAKTRAACAEALGVMSFIVSDDTESLEVMKLMENVFRASYLKGDGSTPTHQPAIASLHNSALLAWNLLLTVVPSHASSNSSIERYLSRMGDLMESPDVELRCSAGESIALLYELAREEDEDFEGEDMLPLCARLKELATESHKYRAKKDRRLQRASFRDILRAVEEGDAPSCRVRVGLMDVIYIESWSIKRQYDSLCHVIGTGMSIHLQENELVRDIFGLGAPVPTDMLAHGKASRTERHHHNSAAFKARTKSRAKNRDKRSVASSMM